MLQRQTNKNTCQDDQSYRPELLTMYHNLGSDEMNPINENKQITHFV